MRRFRRDTAPARFGQYAPRGVGSPYCSVVRVGELFRAAIRDNAAAIIVAHNHPSGDASPSGDDLDLTVRGAISIGRRLMDPLAELVKIDPPSLGIGQYQHDVNAKQLARELDLVAHSPDVDDIVTYPRLNRRLDWILISEPLRFEGFKVLRDEVSDHLVVVADVGVDQDSQFPVARLDEARNGEG